MRLPGGLGLAHPASPRKLSLGVVINKEHAAKYGKTPEEQLEGIIDNDPRLKRDCGAAAACTAVATYADYQLIPEMERTGWAAVGRLRSGSSIRCSPPGFAWRWSPPKSSSRRSPPPAELPRVEARVAAYVEWFRENLEAVAKPDPVFLRWPHLRAAKHRDALHEEISREHLQYHAAPR